MNWQSIIQRQQGWTVEEADFFRLSIDEATELYVNAPLHELTKAADSRRKNFIQTEKLPIWWIEMSTTPTYVPSIASFVLSTVRLVMMKITPSLTKKFRNE